MSGSAAARDAYRPFHVEVTGVRRVSPSFVRVTLGGAELAGLADAGPGGPRDTRIKVVIPPPGGGAAFAGIDPTTPGWQQAWRARDEALRGWARSYTIADLRRDATGTEIDVDFVLHEPAGPASAWAAGAEIGDQLAIIGPDAGVGAAYEWRAPADARRLLVVADETALPAVEGIIRTLQPDAVGEILVELPVADDARDWSLPAGIAVRWLPRRPTDAHGDRLVTAVRALPRAMDAAHASLLPEDDVEKVWQPAAPAATAASYAWVAGEAGVVRQLRRILLTEKGFRREEVSFMGYWRRDPHS